MKKLKPVTGINLDADAPNKPRVLTGDSIYYKHPEHGGPHHGVVAGIGKHGMLVDADGGGEHQVEWNGYIAHRARAERKMTIVDKGEDGSIMEDENGKRVFVRGKIEDYDLGSRDDAETLEKALISVPVVPVTPENHPLNETLRTMSNLLDAMNKTPLLIDIGPLSCGCSDDVLEYMHKALGDDDHDIWRPHESPFIRDLIEKWTSFGLDRLGKILAELMRWIKGVFHKPSKNPVPKPKLFARWDKNELEGAKLYLEALPPEAFTLDDWMMVVDYLVQKYLPQDVLMDDAKWQVTRASMMGRVQKHMPEMAAVAAGAAAAKMPVDLNVIQRDFGMTAAQKAAIDFGQHRCCQYVTNVAESARVKMKLAVVGWKKEEFEGVPSAMAKRNLEGKLLDEFAVLNKDWRRIALTEAGEMANQGFVASMPVGQKLKRMEQYAGACPYCRKIDQKVVTVVDAAKQDKNYDTEIWAGKDNIGRSASPLKRVGGQLVRRPDSELWSIPAGLAHPHCRGRWAKVSDAKPADDQKFADWLNNHFKKK